MFIQQRLLHLRQLRRQLAAEDAHIGDLFQHDSVMHRVFGVFPPGKRAVRVHQHAGHLRWIDAFFTEGFDDHRAGFPFVLAVDLLVGHQTGTGDRAVEVVGVGGAGGGNRLSGLRPDGGVTRMGMNNAAQRRECLIQQAVGWGIRRGFFLAFNHFAGLQADHHHIFGAHYAVVDAGGFNYQHPPFTVDGADVAPGEGNQIVLRQGQVGFENLAFEIF